MKKRNNGNRDSDINEKENKPGRKNKYPRKKIHADDFQKLVKKRAYDIYQQRVQSNAAGDDLSDWYQAVEEMKFSNFRKKNEKTGFV